MKPSTQKFILLFFWLTNSDIQYAGCLVKTHYRWKLFKNIINKKPKHLSNNQILKCILGAEIPSAKQSQKKCYPESQLLRKTFNISSKAAVQSQKHVSLRTTFSSWQIHFHILLNFLNGFCLLWCLIKYVPFTFETFQISSNIYCQFILNWFLDVFIEEDPK